MISKICAECGKQFQTLQPNQMFCNDKHYRKCVVCGEEFFCDVKNCNSRKTQTCSRKCAAVIRKQSLLSKDRVCEYCGSVYRSSGNTTRLCNNQHYSTCSVCGQQFPVSNDLIINNQIPLTCSTQCKEIQRRRTNLDRYGVEIASRSDYVRQKLHDSAMLSEPNKKQTCLIRYGTDNVAKTIDVRNKISETLRSNEYQEKFQNKMRSRYGVNYPMQSAELRSKQARNVKKRSSLEIRLHNMLEQYNIKYVSEYVLKKDSHVHSFDVYLPEYKILIDCDGEFFHSYQSDPDGVMVRDDYDDVRLYLVPKDHVYVVIVESEFERGLVDLRNMISRIDNKTFNYDSELFQWCRKNGFPYYNYTDSRLISDWNSLVKYDAEQYNPYCKLGISLVNQFHRSIFDCYVDKHVSPKEAWEDDRLLKKVILNRLIYQNDVNPSKVLAGFNISKIAPKVSIFNPTTAKYLIANYASEYSKIVDPFSGFSGRMLGAASLGKEYVGSDVRESAVEESNKIIQFLKLNNVNVNVEDVLTSSSTEFSNSCLFTCPPYGMKEIYLDGQVNKNCDDWIDICLQKFLCDRYVFVVDTTNRYLSHVQEELKSESHFRNNHELVIVIDRS